MKISGVNKVTSNYYYEIGMVGSDDYLFFHILNLKKSNAYKNVLLFRWNASMSPLETVIQVKMKLRFR